jgi:hypothetical protein
LEELGLDEWQKAVAEVASLLQRAMLADYVLLGRSGAENSTSFPMVAVGAATRTRTLSG